MCGCITPSDKLLWTHKMWIKNEGDLKAATKTNSFCVLAQKLLHLIQLFWKIHEPNKVEKIMQKMGGKGQLLMKQ